MASSTPKFGHQEGVPSLTSTFPRHRLPSAADARDGANGRFPLTEVGTADRLVAGAAGNLRFVPERRSWLHWRLNQWVEDADGAAVRQLCASLPGSLYCEAADAVGKDADLIISWARKCQSAQVIRNVTAIASDHAAVRTPVALLDADQLLAGLDEGRSILNLRNGQVRPSRPDDLITKSLGVDAVGDARLAINFHRFLGDVFCGDREIIDYLQVYLFYCLTGRTHEHALIVGIGNGANGKSVLETLLRGLWGDYCRVIQPETLMSQHRTGSGPAPDKMRLIGARLALASETEEGRPLDEAFVKQLTGGDTITARDMYSKPVEFTPQLKLMLMGNHLPKIKGVDNGIWRRIRLLPFSRTFQPHEQDPQLAAKLAGERPHILAWILEGRRRYFTDGLPPIPKAMTVAATNYRTEENIVGVWRSERTEPAGATMCSILYADFRTWCEGRGERAMTLPEFGKRLAAAGLDREHTRNGARYLGLRLRARPVTA